MGKLLLKALLKATKNIAINKTKRLLGAKVIDDLIRVQKMNSSLGIGKYSRQIKVVDKIFKKDNKVERMFYEATRKNQYLRKAFNIYKAEQEKDLRKAQAEYNRLQTRIEQDMIYQFKTGKGISKKEFTTFRDYFLSKNLQTQHFLKDLMKEELRLIFKSSGILFGLFIPYGRKQKKGILCLQLYNTTSQRNPTLFYQGVRVPMWVGEELEKEPTGEQFGKKGYRENYDNKMYLTNESIYYNNNINKKQKKKVE